MKNYLFVTILIATWQTGQSENKRNIGEQVTKNVEYEKKILNIQGYYNKVIGNVSKKNITGMPIVNFGVEKGGEIENIYRSDRSDDKTGDYDDDRGVFERNGYTFDIDAGNPDIHGEIKRPCQVYDTFCIRKFFAEHSQCKISGRAVPDPFYQAQGTVNFASVNISESHINAIYRGLSNARVSEFYINKVTDNLVIAFTFDNASKTINNGYYKYYLRGREPVVTRDFIGIQYGVLTITVIIPQLHDLKLDRAEIYTYGDTAIYPFALGPGIAESTDPEVTAMYASFFTNIPTDYQEEISNQGNFMVGNYIQYNICDFGLKAL